MTLNFHSKLAFVMIHLCIMRIGRGHLDFTILNVSNVPDLVLFLMKKNAFVLVTVKNFPKLMLMEICVSALQETV